MSDAALLLTFLFSWGLNQFGILHLTCKPLKLVLMKRTTHLLMAVTVSLCLTAPSASWAQRATTKSTPARTAVQTRPTTTTKTATPKPATTTTTKTQVTRPATTTKQTPVKVQSQPSVAKPAATPAARPSTNTTPKPAATPAARPSTSTPAKPVATPKPVAPKPVTTPATRPSTTTPSRPSATPSTPSKPEPAPGPSTNPGGGNSRPNSGHGTRPGDGAAPAPGPGPQGNPGQRPPNQAFRPDVQRPHNNFRGPDYRPPRPQGGYWGPPPPSALRPIFLLPPPPPPRVYVNTGIPVLNLVLGTAFGTFIDYSINQLFNSGYKVLGYENNAVYLSNVNQLGFNWPQCTFFYTDGLFSDAQFQYWTSYPQPNRYDLVSRELSRIYGAPINSSVVNGIVTTSWWAGGSTGYVTLQYGPSTGAGGLNYYTTLTYSSM